GARVPARRAGPGQSRVLAEHAPERRDAPRDDRLHRGFKALDRATLPDLTDKLREVRPRLEAVIVGDDKLRIREIERRGPDVGHRLAAKERVHPLEAPPRGLVARLDGR